MLSDARILLKKDHELGTNNFPLPMIIHACRIHDPVLKIWRCKVVYTNCFKGWNSYGDTK